MRKGIYYIKNNFIFCFGLLLLIFLFFMAFFGQYLPFIDEDLEKIDFVMTEGSLSVAPFEPSKEHLLGTDREGRDMLSLIVMGAKETLLIVILVTLIRYLLAIPLSYLAHKKFLGANVFLKGLNQFFSYVPTIIMVVLLATLPPFLFSDTRPYLLILIIAFVEVGRAAEMIKVDLDEIASKEFIQSGLAVGANSFTLLKSYYLPFLYGKVSVYFISDISKVMFLLGQLGLIGIFISQDLIQVEIGVFEMRNDSISWPMLLMNSTLDIRGPIWIPFWSAFAMTLTIFTFNLIAHGIQNLPKKKDSYI
ncbi:peptide ABC transporter permease [Ornithinibacillus salinisoli]|uniref:Peptide ABC transporter permease n=1 Tax=Ornithinibacillus salinisoli TaxID=1848459 RepID=A0ABW4VV05_9BACI